jgi:hypothetical protein
METTWVWAVSLNGMLYGIYSTHYGALKAAQRLWEVDPKRPSGCVKVTRERVESETDSLESILSVDEWKQLL